MMSEGGFEPPPLSGPEPKSGASASSATRPSNYLKKLLFGFESSNGTPIFCAIEFAHFSTMSGFLVRSMEV